MVASGRAFTVTVVAGDVAVQPFAFVTCTVKMPLDVTSIDCVVWPFDQSQDAPSLAVSVTVPPWQNVVAPEAVIVAAGRAFTVTVAAGDVALQPFAFVTCTVKLSLDVTSMDCVVSPFDQSQDAPSLAVSVTVPPSQNVDSEGVIVAAGRACTVTVVADDVVLQPLAFVTVTL
jgi:hypothetical protein